MRSRWEAEEAGGRKRKSEIGDRGGVKVRRLSKSNTALPETTGDSTCETYGRTRDLDSFAERRSEGNGFEFVDLESQHEDGEVAADVEDVSERTSESVSAVIVTDSGTHGSAKAPPTEDELEEFFGALEANLRQEFITKYNYDILKDQPLPSEGRFQWFKLPLHP